MAGIGRHSQTKGRATGNAKPGLEPPGGRCGYKRKRSSGRCGARSRIGARYSGTESEQKAPDRHRRVTTPIAPKRPVGGGRPRAVWQRRASRTGGVHGGSADKFAERKTLRRHRGDRDGGRRRGGGRNPAPFHRTDPEGRRLAGPRRCSKEKTARAV